MATVVLGNSHPIRPDNGQAVGGKNILTIPLPGAPWTADEQLRAIVSHPELGHPGDPGIWLMHSGAPAPDWVMCPGDPELEKAIADHFGCPIGRPDGWLSDYELRADTVSVVGDGAVAPDAGPNVPPPPSA